MTTMNRMRGVAESRELDINQMHVIRPVQEGVYQLENAMHC